MELRKDPITRSWVITSDVGELLPDDDDPCRFCPGSARETLTVGSEPALAGGEAPWSARAMVHPAPLYRIEGDPARTGIGLYDSMRAVGAHEVLVENPRHDRQLWQASDAEIGQFLRLAAHRIHDLKRDPRFKYITLFKNVGRAAGQDFQHPNSQIIATTFVPRRVLYELRACREFFAQKERCVFCDILAFEEKDARRIVERMGDFVSACPYAPRVPYETWVLPRVHESSFESGIARRSTLQDMAALLRRTLRRIQNITDSVHLVLHTTPNTSAGSSPGKSKVVDYWKTLDDDYHWHIEILPILAGRSKSYTFKEIYFSDITPERAAQRLREAKAE